MVIAETSGKDSQLLHLNCPCLPVGPGYTLLDSMNFFFLLHSFRYKIRSYCISQQPQHVSSPITSIFFPLKEALEVFGALTPLGH